MAVKQVKPTLQLDGGLLIPASASAGLVLTSDASGNATWQTATSGDLTYDWRLPTGSETVPADKSAIVVGDYEVASGQVLEIAANGVMEIS